MSQNQNIPSNSLPSQPTFSLNTTTECYDSLENSFATFRTVSKLTDRTTTISSRFSNLQAYPFDVYVLCIGLDTIHICVADISLRYPCLPRIPLMKAFWWTFQRHGALLCTPYFVICFAAFVAHYLTASGISRLSLVVCISTMGNVSSSHSRYQDLLRWSCSCYSWSLRTVSSLSRRDFYNYYTNNSCGRAHHTCVYVDHVCKYVLSRGYNQRAVCLADWGALCVHSGESKCPWCTSRIWWVVLKIVSVIHYLIYNIFYESTSQSIGTFLGTFTLHVCKVYQ